MHDERSNSRGAVMRSYIGHVGLAVLASAFLMASPALADDWFPAYSTYNDGMWNKLYVGAHVGAAWGDSDWFSPDFNTRTSPGLDTGTAFGGQVGILHQFGPLVAGAEASYSQLDDVDGASICPNPNFSCHNSVDNLLLVNGRLGYAFGPVLLYGTGGYARADVSVSTRTIATDALFEHASNDVSGWNVGGGIEYQFTRNVSLAVQYVHVDLQDNNYRLLNGANNFVENVRVNPDFDVIEARLNILLDTRREYLPPEPLK
jgi:outer membrane immunogenic protein